MPEYTIQFTNSAASEFRALPLEIKRRVGKVVDSLKQTPRPSKVRKLQGHDKLYRVRIGHYRLVYEINDQTQHIRVTRVRHRSDAYR